MNRNPRIAYLLFALSAMAAGLASRNYAAHLPDWLAEYGGDCLWGMMVYGLFGLLLAGRPFRTDLWYRAAFAMLFAFGIEFSQLYQALWINSLRETRLGGLVLGFGFLWTDLVCYTVGIALGAAGEWLAKRGASPIGVIRNS